MESNEARHPYRHLASAQALQVMASGNLEGKRGTNPLIRQRAAAAQSSAPVSLSSATVCCMPHEGNSEADGDIVGVNSMNRCRSRYSTQNL